MVQIVSARGYSPIGHVYRSRRFYIHYIMPISASLWILRTASSHISDVIDDSEDEDDFECCPGNTPKWIKIAPRRVRPILCGWRLLIKVIADGSNCTCLSCPGTESRRRCNGCDLPLGVEQSYRDVLSVVGYMTSGVFRLDTTIGPGVGIIFERDRELVNPCCIVVNPCETIARGVRGSYQIVSTPWYDAAIIRPAHICWL
jgi:hypothetical protein